MPGPFPYLQEDEVDHQAPGCPVILSYDMHTVECTAIFDTGAEYTSVPIAIIEAFSLERKGEMEIDGAVGESATQGLYRINLEFLGFVAGYHLVLGGTGAGSRDCVLIGRDILNRYHLLLEGPQLQFTIN